MDPNETLPVQAARVAAEFAGTWADGWMVDEIARQLNQSEVVPMARLLHVYGEPKAAEMWVQAWIDFNRDFDWSDPGEQVLRNHPVLDGTNTVNIAIPATALPGTTFARFRLTRTENLGFTGVATGGEVEDHRVEITAAGPPLRIGTIRLDGPVVELSRGW